MLILGISCYFFYGLNDNNAFITYFGHVKNVIFCKIMVDDSNYRHLYVHAHIKQTINQRYLSNHIDR